MTNLNPKEKISKRKLLTCQSTAGMKNVDKSTKENKEILLSSSSAGIKKRYSTPFSQNNWELESQNYKRQMS